MNRVSDKRQAQMPGYYLMLAKIGGGWPAKSEMSGIWGAVPHHIQGRRGAHLYDPFNIILVTDAEHREIHAHNTPELKAKLAGIVKELRIRQGFTQEGTEGRYSGAIKDLEEEE